jgi:ABC-type transport system involved in cytochrome bd biosynthesis fused ATPase/permease subunit
MIQDAMDRLVVGRTTFIIAHRLSTVIKADRILVMQEGSIVESGTHLELLLKGGAYRDLYEKQFESISTAEQLLPQPVLNGRSVKRSVLAAYGGLISTR